MGNRSRKNFAKWYIKKSQKRERKARLKGEVIAIFTKEAEEDNRFFLDSIKWAINNGFKFEISPSLEEAKKEIIDGEWFNDLSLSRCLINYLREEKKEKDVYERMCDVLRGGAQ